MPDKPLIRLGSSLRDLQTFRRSRGGSHAFQLRRVQQGLHRDDWKPMGRWAGGPEKRIYMLAPPGVLRDKRLEAIDVHRAA